MFSPTKKLPIPDDFNFPFEPYDIQAELMKSLYSVIENKQIGIYESPTGTGKSLTLTCGSLRWLLDHQQLVKNEIIEKIQQINTEIIELEIDSLKNTNWIDSQFNAIQKKDEINHLTNLKELIEQHDQHIKNLQEKRLAAAKQKKNYTNRRRTSEDCSGTSNEPETTTNPDNNEDYIIEDCDPDEDDEKLLENDVKTTQYKDVKIFFCSRTHSQLSQIVKEIKRTIYGNQIRCISLASRQILCINPDVRKLKTNNLINEKCLDMQKSKSKVTSMDENGCCQKKSRLKQSSTKCIYKNLENIHDLCDNSLTNILDIEDLIQDAKQLQACPYYSSRESIENAQIIMLPYQMILHKKTRIQSGINLKHNILIIDEAHNLLDTISNIYSTEINLYQLQTAIKQMNSYKIKYISRFSTKNLLKINQLIFVTKRLVTFFNEKCTETYYEIFKTHQLMANGEFYNINLYHLLEFCETTRFAQKVHGYAQKYTNDSHIKNNEPSSSGITNLLKKMENNQVKKIHKKSSHAEEITVKDDDKNIQTTEKVSSVIRPLLTFLESLTECAEDGRIFINYNSDIHKAGMKYCLLNPGEHFEEIIQECRSIIIAGGTMQPTTELTDQLFKNHTDKIQQHFFNHVVPKESVLPFVVPKGPTGKNFIFNYQNRHDKQILNELGMTLLNICNVTPAGIICFVSSYDYLETIYSHFIQQNIIQKIENKKFIFREPRSNNASQSIDKILSQYSVAVKDPSKNGAILFSVVGGKLSEGLNFTDDLGRCVIVIGMPYPNKNSPELQEKMKYLNNIINLSAGTEYYDNLCMKAVNQCIGRSVRHINDYASVILLDERYSTDRVQQKLPAWIRSNLKVSTNFGLMQASIAKFFRTRKN